MRLHWIFSLLFLFSCASVPKPKAKAVSARESQLQVWTTVGIVIGAIAVPLAIRAVAQQGHPDYRWFGDPHLALAIGLYPGMLVGGGLGTLLGKAVLSRSPEQKAGPEAVQAASDSRDAELAKARQFEAESQWSSAWGAYRRAKDLGPPSQFIDDKLIEIEQKLGVVPNP